MNKFTLFAFFILLHSPRTSSQYDTAVMEEAGLLAIKTKSILMRTGTHHAIINTSSNITMDIDNIEQIWSKYAFACQAATRRYPDTNCEDRLDDIKAIHDKSISVLKRLINNESFRNIKSKAKRSKGLFERMMDYLIGTSDPETDAFAFRSASATKHAIEEFKSVEEDIAYRQKLLSGILDQTKTKVKSVEVLFGNATAINKLNNDFDTSHQATIFHITQIMGKYDLMSYEDIIENELDGITETIRNKFSGSTLPQIPKHQLRELIGTSLIVQNGSVAMISDIPIVSNSIAVQYFLIPAPDASTGLMPDFSPGPVNVLEQEYFKTPELTTINETLSMTRHPIVVFNKLSDSTPCEIRSVITKTSNCTLKKMNEAIDMWIETPVPNMIAFISNSTKMEKCMDSSRKIKQISGFLKLKPQCRIITEKHTVYSPLDRSSYKFEIYKFDHLILPTLPTTTSTEPATINTLPPVNDTGLEQAEAEAEDVMLSHGNYSLTEIIIITSFSIIAAGIVLGCGWIIYLKYDRVRVADREEDLELAERQSRLASAPDSASAHSPTPAPHQTVDENRIKSEDYNVL
jgi:hypothetical protein